MRRVCEMSGSELPDVSGKFVVGRSGGGAAGVSDGLAHAGGARGAAAGRGRAGSGSGKRSGERGDSNCEVFWRTRDFDGRDGREAGEGAGVGRGFWNQLQVTEDSRGSAENYRKTRGGRGVRTRGDGDVGGKRGEPGAGRAARDVWEHDGI